MGYFPLIKPKFSFYSNKKMAFIFIKKNNFDHVEALEYDYALMYLYVFDQAKCELVQIDYDKLD